MPTSIPKYNFFYFGRALIISLPIYTYLTTICNKYSMQTLINSLS